MRKIGIIGGGQLGKMMILAAKYMDYDVIILDPTPDCPAHSIADEHIVADFDDKDAIKCVAEKSEVVTYEFEHINLKALKELEESGYKIYPASETLSHIQNKLVQKKWLHDHGIPIPDFREVTGLLDLMEVGNQFGYPFILKTCTGGYDGKGNAVVRKAGEEKAAYELLGEGKLPLMAEKWIPFEKEISVIVCRSTNGQTVIFPIAENVHVNSILDETTVPALISENTEEAAKKTAADCMEAVNAYGILCIEMFVTKSGEIMVNELAPRPHNSGHYTIEGCVTSQYEQHIRAITGLPLGSTALMAPTAMKNMIGQRDGDIQLQGLDKALENENLKVHVYGKKKVSIGRKMGHLTATGHTIEEALEQVRFAHEKIKF